jgi:hypothetical protein
MRMLMRRVAVRGTGEKVRLDERFDEIFFSM